jgi:multidrug efflux pump subunit AcrA (membrane-fusion protein)
LNETSTPLEPQSSLTSSKRSITFWERVAVVTTAVIAGAIFLGPRLSTKSSGHPAVSPELTVDVSAPVERKIGTRLQFLGQFSAVERVELRAQVGGTLTQIGYKDGDVVRRGDLLFEIDPTPYEIKLSEAKAQLESSHSRLDLASRELLRAETLKQTDAGSIQNVDQRAAEKQTAQAAVSEAEALVRDARFDLDHCRITAPFTGRMGSRLGRESRFRKSSGQQSHDLAGNTRLAQPNLFEL